MFAWRVLSRTYATGGVATGTVIFGANLYNSHKYVWQSFENDGPLECFVTTFTYTWLASVKAFGAGLVWPLTINDFVKRSRHNPDSLPLFFSPDKEFDFVKDNTVLQKLLNKRKDKQDS